VAAYDITTARMLWYDRRVPTLKVVNSPKAIRLLRCLEATPPIGLWSPLMKGETPEASERERGLT
jgi:hypothetical protein